MNLAELKRVADAKVSPDRSTFAADESPDAIKKRFEARGCHDRLTIKTERFGPSGG
jgi:fructose-bisphosphate aldolase class 1